jgi:hypothetical protein
MDFLHFGTLPADSHGQHRVKRRAKGYRWFNNRLFKVMQDRDHQALTYRMVPRPDDRDQLVLDNHVELGHLGEKRTIAALAYTYWWYGMTVDVKRVLSGCKLCKRVLAPGGHQQRDMQNGNQPVNTDLFPTVGAWITLWIYQPARRETDTH